MSKSNANAKSATNAAQAAQPQAVATKPQAVALQRPAGQAGAKNGAVAQCWSLYNANPALARSAAVKLAIAEGINPATAATQYQAWFKAARLAAAAQSA